MWHLVRADEDIIGSYAPLHTGRLHLGAADADPETIDRSHALFAWYLRLSRSKRAVDKYPELVFRSEFVRAIFPDARFLVAVRSPWSTLSSVSGWSRTHASDDADWWGIEDRKWRVLWEQGVEGQPANADLAALRLGEERDHHSRAAVEWIVTMPGPLRGADREARGGGRRDPRLLPAAAEPPDPVLRGGDRLRPGSQRRAPRGAAGQAAGGAGDGTRSDLVEADRDRVRAGASIRPRR